MFQLWAPILLAIGASFVAGACISLATLLIDQVRNGEQIRAADLARAGIWEVFNRRDLPEYDALVCKAKVIDVAGYTLKSFTESNEGTFRRRAGEGNPVHIRVLLVDPGCEAARVMEAAERAASGTYRSSTDLVAAHLGDIQNVEIRYVARHLPMMIYRIDDILYCGPFPQDGRSKTALTFKLGQGGWLFDRQLDEFEALWNAAAPGPA